MEFHRPVLRGVRADWSLAAALMLCAAARGAPPALDFAFIPSDDVQPGGPSYDFRISRFEVRNDQFAAFLNDALNNLGNPRGHYMYFDADSGDVYVHQAQQGVVGSSGSGTLLFGASISRDVFYDAASGRYQVIPGREEHPVAGVTWYGAVKFCNWLTLATGLGADQRAYTEAAAGMLNGWHPLTITTDDWAVRDLETSERDALLASLGYRLPMDGGDEGGDPGEYNEWHKAAAWDGAASTNHLYGFGRDLISGQDANFWCSGDPFEDPGDCVVGGTSPVGYYDGTNHGGLFRTNADGNFYGLFDMSGNLWEWMQDQSFEQGDRRNRGGSFRSSPTSLQVTIGAERSAGSARDSTGFRVVQSVLNELLVTPEGGFANVGFWGGPYAPGLPSHMTYRATNVSNREVPIAVFADAPWVDIAYELPAGDVLAAYGAVDIGVTIAPLCEHHLAVGVNTATLAVVNLGDGWRANREVRLTVNEPLTVTPPGNVTLSIPFGRPSPEQRFTISSQSESPVRWSAAWEDTTVPPTGAAWLTLNGEPEGTSDVTEPLGASEVVVGFAVDGMGAGTYTSAVTFTDDCTGARAVRQVSLCIEAPFAVTPPGEVAFTGVFGGPFAPSSHAFTIRSLVSGSVDWRVRVEPVAPATDTEWLNLDFNGGTLSAAGAAQTITATLGAAASSRQVGRYSAALTFEQLAAEQPTGFSVERTVTLEVMGLLVDPTSPAVFRGPLGGPFDPDSCSYTLRNTGLEEMAWTAVFRETVDPPSGIDWLELSDPAGVILNPQGTATVTARPSVYAAALPTGTYSGEVVFTSTMTGATAARPVGVTVGEPAFTMEMVAVPPEHVQPDGPRHLYRIGKFEVTNDEFARFLNDARENADNIRGQFLDYDPASGAVRLAGDGTVIFDPAAGGAITVVNDRYAVVGGKGRLPVVGVSWYGAVKFCNWVTVSQGMDNPDQRIYHEGLDAQDWYALFSAPELLELRGYRLPMDGEESYAAAFNEWYKAAAWIDPLRVSAVYAFGRDVLGNGDANFRDSGDPYEPGPSPVGFYNGVNVLAPDEGVTNASANGYGLYDLTGNVAEWVHDAGYDATERGIRGGHFDSLADSTMLTAGGRGSIPADAVVSFVGFRVAQAVQPGALLVGQDAIRARGPAGGPYSRDGFALEITNLGEQTLDNLAIAIDVPWLAVDGVAPRQAPPGRTVRVPLRITASPESPGISPAPAGDFALVRGSDPQAGGPDYDYWIGRTEVTNQLFAGFLNDALTNALSQSPDFRSAHMYFDVDSGSVYLNEREPGEQGHGAPSGAGNVLLYDAGVGRIHFSGARYAVETGFDDHPVVGVSWFGGIKYCNWLTIRHGIPQALRAYAEAPSPLLEGWHPLAVDDATWLGGPLSSLARRSLIEDTLGYRLPMDDEAAGASSFNEWYKAASRAGTDELGNPTFGAGYGCGRDGPLSGADANFLASGDTDLDSTTPVAFFDGLHALFFAPSNCYPPPLHPGSTRDTENGYRLHDACGNAAEWVQDFFAGDFHQRATRGGSWLDAPDSRSLTTLGRLALPPETTDDRTGLRVVRGTGHVGTVTVSDPLAPGRYQRHFILDLFEPFSVEPLTPLDESGMYGDAFSGRGTSYTLTNSSASQMQWEVAASAAWVDVSGPVAGERGGLLEGGRQARIDVEINTGADELGPGVHTAAIILRNVTTGQSQSRDIVLTIGKPVSVAPLDPPPHKFIGTWGGPFDMPFAVRAFNLASQVNYGLQYRVTVSQPWLSVEPADPRYQLSGMLQAGGIVEFKVRIGVAAENLPVGEHQGIIRFAVADPSKPGVWDLTEQRIELSVGEPLMIAQNADPWRVGPNPDPTLVPPQVYTLVNGADRPIEVVAASDSSWITLPWALIEVPSGPEAGRAIPVNINDSVLSMHDGEYTATITFEDLTTGIVQCRTVVLTIVESISVSPFDGFITAGVPGMEARPALKTYRVTNVARDGGGPVSVQISVDQLTADWILVNGGTAYEAVLADGESASVVISIDLGRTAGLMEGDYQGRVRFQVVPGGDPVDRTVSLTLSWPLFNLAESAIPGAILQPGGPEYSFVMATFPTTNSEYVAFLNDAMANPDNGRGQYMFFNTTTGDVYVNSSVVGQQDSDAGLRSLKMFSPAVSAQIALRDGRYAVVSDAIDFSDHPVTGVSWYGALKFCNWLTIDQGMLPRERCYVEDTDASPHGWRPVTSVKNTWLQRDLWDAERLNLVVLCRGYRLPMDDGSNNADVTRDGPDAYNEWYKAASYIGESQQGAPVFGAAYGFGRSGPLQGADANFLHSGDPLDEGTTPVGYYDGSIKDGWFATAPNNNGFGIYDLTGNVYQWVQDRFNAHPASINFRALRGGSWNTSSSAPELETRGRTFTVPHLADGQVGFRVVRVPDPPSGDVDGDGDVDAGDYTATVVCLGGPEPGVLPGCALFDLDLDGDIDLRDFAEFAVVFGSPSR